jgi:hypothetical protein
LSWPSSFVSPTRSLTITSSALRGRHGPGSSR